MLKRPPIPSPKAVGATLSVSGRYFPSQEGNDWAIATKLLFSGRRAKHPAASKNVTFNIGPEMLALYDEDMNRVVEPGESEIIVGPSSAEGKSTTLRVIE